MASLFDIHVRNTLERYVTSSDFKSWLRDRVKWQVQGFEPGFNAEDRERFTATVAARIRKKARRPIYLFGVRIWRAPERMNVCASEAERIVTDFLRDERIQFGDPQYYWDDGADLADADMEYWEGCP